MRMTLAALMFTLAACGSDALPPDEPLPKAPQLMPNPGLGILLFELIEAGDTATLPVVIVNGGQDDLVLSSPNIDDGSYVGPDGASPFTLGTLPTLTIRSREAAAIPVQFAPDARGVHQADLVISSNAENLPHLVYRLVGPAGHSPLPDGPDLALVTDTFTADESNVAVVRYFNLGGAMLIVTRYELGDASFALQSGVNTPGQECAALTCPITSVPVDCSPVRVSSGAFVNLGLDFVGAARPATATFTIVSNDAVCPTTATLSAP